MMSEEYPEFQLRLPRGGPVARGRLLREKGAGGSPRFEVLAGSPARADVSPSFGRHVRSFSSLRESLIADGSIVPSQTWSGYLETARDIVCEAPSAAAAILLGTNANGWKIWKTADGHPLEDFVEPPWSGPNHTWLVRGSNVLGLDLVQRLWLPERVVSLAAGHLRRVEQGVSKDLLRTFVDEDYESTLTYNQRLRLVDELYAFLTRMKPGDTVCTISNGSLYVGEITGDVEQVASEGGRSNLRRPVDWRDEGYPYHELPEELQQKLSVQHDVVDLTTVEGLVAGLGRTDEELEEEARESPGDTSVEIAALARRELELPEPTSGLAGRLLVHDVAWLREVRDLLWDDRQIIFYGPPGTGKTYLALSLAEYLAGGPEQVKLVQFHPSYAYEDFFEGFRPQEDPVTREVAFRLTDGPLRELADAAAREGNRHLPHFLVIDEINRANLAKVFGELYFLLEYRNRSVRLTYSGDDFALPPNLFVIGTMNTADRSIALVDAAMRRRFSFVELSPRAEPTSGLLRRWLKREGHDFESADLLDALNARIDDPDFQVGPSFLMRNGVHREGGLERAWRTKILPLLKEHHYGEGLDVEQRYGLRALRKAIGTTPQEPPNPE
ncbi:5-methylcytosine-specific restriction protein B [Prauserella shujinwangii]|uniref:5-methylcytosine-specific restriction protein B n=1 Tax=Prauserella shujinwangii TaxID=1453103 RepID=A0A2T0M2A0_9PSEU|nr:5-methylcytosine-specific restriction protein B [Prauserella shujinwangii]